MKYHSFSVKNHIRQKNLVKSKFTFVDMFLLEHPVETVTLLTHSQDEGPGKSKGQVI